MIQNEAERFYTKCIEYGISINLRNKHLYKECGLRIGTQEISRYGWKDTEMQIIAEILRDIRDSDHFSQDISNRINDLSANKELCYTIAPDCYDIVHSLLHYS